MRLEWISTSPIVTVGINRDACDRIVAKIISILSMSGHVSYELSCTSLYRTLEEEEWRKVGEFLSFLKAQEYFEKFIWSLMLWSDPPVANTGYYGDRSLDKPYAEKMHQYRMGVAVESLVYQLTDFLKKLGSMDFTTTTGWWKK